MHKAIDDALKCRHPGRRWKRKLKRARRVYAIYDCTGIDRLSEKDTKKRFMDIIFNFTICIEQSSKEAKMENPCIKCKISQSEKAACCGCADRLEYEKQQENMRGDVMRIDTPTTTAGIKGCYQ